MKRIRCGFSLIEVIVAIMLFAVGILGMASIMGATVRTRALTLSRSEMRAAADAKIEELRAYGMTSSTDTFRLRLVPGGSTSTEAVGYADTVPGSGGRIFVRRWQLGSDVAGTLRATVNVSGKGGTAGLQRPIEFSTLLGTR